MDDSTRIETNELLDGIMEMVQDIKYHITPNTVDFDEAMTAVEDMQQYVARVKTRIRDAGGS